MIGIRREFSDPEIAKLAIVHYPDPVLREACATIEAFDPWVETLAKHMLVLMRGAKGLGLAAPQVGIPMRLFVANITEDPANDRVYINPRLTDPDGGVSAEEGCLSLPDVHVAMMRAKAITINAFDAKGNPFTARAEEMLARVWQHECDHLDGRLIIDRMDTQAELENRRLLKSLEDTFARRGGKSTRLDFKQEAL